MDKYDLSRFALSYAGADPDQIARMNAELNTSPVRVVRDERPKQQDRSTIWALKIGGKYGFRPGMVVTEDAHLDLAREISPEGQQARFDYLVKLQNGDFRHGR